MIYRPVRRGGGGSLGSYEPPSRICGTKNTESNHFVVVQSLLRPRSIVFYDLSLHTHSSTHYMVYVTAFHFIMTSLGWK